MYRFKASFIKEFLLLIRDFGALIILFVMPIVIVITVTLIQNSSFQKINDIDIPVAIINKDDGAISDFLKSELNHTDNFSVEYMHDSTSLKSFENKVLKEKYQIGIIIPEGLSKRIEDKVNNNLAAIYTKMGLTESSDVLPDPNDNNQVLIQLIFDPEIQQSLKENIQQSIQSLIATVENKVIYSKLESEFDMKLSAQTTSDIITFEEIAFEEIAIPNASQHNVPAWTVFAIFFIVIPFSISMVKEKTQGTNIRLQSLPVSNHAILLPKIILYLIVCLLQFAVVFVVGFYIFPLLNLPSLEISGNPFALGLVSIVTGLAAIGLGLIIGTFFTSVEQAAPFGATIVILLSAIGGLWVPEFVMPKTIQMLSKVSPLNWSLDGFHEIILKNGGFLDVSFSVITLISFFVLCYSISYYKYKLKRR